MCTTHHITIRTFSYVILCSIHCTLKFFINKTLKKAVWRNQLCSFINPKFLLSATPNVIPGSSPSYMPNLLPTLVPYSLHWESLSPVPIPSIYQNKYTELIFPIKISLILRQHQVSYVCRSQCDAQHFSIRTLSCTKFSYLCNILCITISRTYTPNVVITIILKGDTW